MKCIHCESDRIINVGAKCSDLCNVEFNGVEHDGYVPSDIGIGSGDYIDLDYCLECGKIQGKFPIKNPSFVKEDEYE